MLYLDAAAELDSVTVYRDYSDKTRFYYTPKSPRLSVESGQPMFQLLIYRDVDAAASESTGGGFLAMTTDLGVAHLDSLRDAVSSRYGVQANLVPLPVKSGSVRVIALDSGRAGAPGSTEPRFVEDMVASGTPSLYGDERAVFTTQLTKKGAVLMRAALEGEGATPIVVIYDLRFVGLLPAYDVKITIKFDQSYQHLRSRSQMNTLWFKSDIDREVESLRKSGAIKIEEVVYETENTEQAAARMTRLNALAKDLAQWTFFKPGLNPGTVLAADRGTLQAYDATADLSKITAGLTSTSRAALTGVGATQDVGTPRRPGAGVATDALESTPPAATPGGANAPAAQQPAGAADSQPLTAVEAWNRAGRPQGAFLLRSLEQEERQEIVYELRQVAAVERSIAPQGQIRMLEGAVGLKGRILEVDLKADFFKTIGGKVSTNADLAAMGVSSVIVKLRYGVKDDGTRPKDEAEIPLSAAGSSGTYRFSVDRVGTRDVEFQVVLNYKPDAAIGFEAATETSEWQATTTRDLDINPLAFSSIIPVHMVAAMVDWNLVKQIQAHVQYQDGGLTASDTKILTKDAPTGELRIRPKNPAVRDVSVSAQFFYADGATETRTLAHSGDEPFVINQSPDATVLVGLQLADVLARYKRVTVQLGRPGTGAEEVLQTVNLGEGATEAQWSFRRAQPHDSTFQYRATAFLKDGSVREGEWLKTDNPLVIVGDRAAGMLTVQVMFLGLLADGGFRLAKLNLSYPDAPAWADAHVEHVFRTGSEDFSWRVPMEHPDATSYTYTVTWFAKDGSQKKTGPLTVKDEILLLDPLAV